MTSELYAVRCGRFRPAPLMVLGIALLMGSASSSRGAAASPVTERVYAAADFSLNQQLLTMGGNV